MTKIACLEYFGISELIGREYNYDYWVEHIYRLTIWMTKDKLMTFDEVDFPNFKKDWKNYIYL